MGGCTGDSGGPVMVVEEVDNKDTRSDNRREYCDLLIVFQGHPCRYYSR